MSSNQTLGQFVLLPARGLVARGPAVPPRTASFLTQLANAPHDVAFFRATLANEPEHAPLNLRVIDSIHEDGAKLVEMPLEEVSALQAAQPSLRVVPVVYYYPALAPRPELSAGALTSRHHAAASSFHIRI